MARFTTDFLTWLKGLFHTKTEVNTLLDKKINTVDVQGKITRFTNKDRINIERLINYMENGSGSNYYTLTLRATPVHAFSETVNNAATTANLGVTNGYVASADNKNSACFVIDLRKNGAIQKSSLPTIALKSIDGTKILEFEPNTFSFNTASGYKFGLARDFFGSTPGIHYVYAEATISGSVYKSNILGVFVKDTNNLLSHNQWSVGEYGGSTVPDISWGVTIHQTNEYSIIGEQSLKAIATSTTNGIRFNYNNSLTNKTVTAKLYLRTESTVWVVIREMSSNNEVINSTSSSFTGIGDVELSLSSSSNNSSFQIQLFSIPINAVVYIDNVRLYSS